ncbi:MAG: hypothetical protein Kow0063_02340 [Anaerolineae bacterium]
MAQSGRAIEAFEELQARLEQQLEEQALLLQVSQWLASSFDLAKTMPQVAQAAHQAASADVARVVLGDEIASNGFGAGRLAAELAHFDPLILSLSRQIGQAILTDLSRFANDVAYGPLAARLSAVALWPLPVETRQQGILWLGYETPHTFTESETTFLSTLAGEAAIAIANARSYQEAQRGRKRLEAVLRSTTDPILVVDQDGQVSLLNPAAEEVLNLKVSEALNQPVAAVLQAHPSLLRFFMDNMDLAEGEEWTSPDGRIFSPRLSRVEGGPGEPGSEVLILRDITHFERLHKNQEEFVRLVSHDLRSTLTYMKGFANLLTMSGDLDENQAKFVEKILGGITQITALVDNIQDAGRWDPETGFYEMSREACDLVTIVRDVVSNHQELARKQNIAIKTDIAPNIPIVNVDSLMIERALINLVSNAIKYSPNGGEVTASIRVENKAVLICVSDTGLGIAKEDIPRLFQRGSRIVTPEIKKHKIKGSGLGLFIVWSVARRHGGDVWVESELGKGSRFYFSIPLTGPNLLGGGQ